MILVCPPEEGKGTVANVLPMAKRAEIIAHLVEGAGIRPTSRLTGTCKQAITALLINVGIGCERLHDRYVRDVDARDIQCDEIWSFVRKKQARVKDDDPAEWGDAWTFVAMTRASKLVLAYKVGKRDEVTTDEFISDLRSRLVTAPLLSSDGFGAYQGAVAQHFRGAVDYGIVHKNYRVGAKRGPDHRYEPPREPFITKRVGAGKPDMARVSTSHIERQNLTMRMHIRRLTRLCNGYSKKIRNHRAAMALHFAYYNFCRIHEALRVTPAIEAGIMDHVWSVEELVERALSEPVGDLPVRRELTVGGSARKLPNGGWLRLVSG